MHFLKLYSKPINNNDEIGFVPSPISNYLFKQMYFGEMPKTLSLNFCLIFITICNNLFWVFGNKKINLTNQYFIF